MSLVKYGGKTKQEQIQHTQPSNFGRPVLSAYSIEQGAKAYDARIARERSEKEFKEWQEQQEQQKKQEFLNTIAAAQNLDHDDVYTVNELYEAAIDKRNEGDGLTAAQYFWTSLVCGEARSAYPLFEMLWNGESGVGRNPEMAGIIFSIGARFKSPECKAFKDIPAIRAAKAHLGEDGLLRIPDNIFRICSESQRLIGSQNITNDIADSQVAKAEEALDRFSSQLKTRAHEEPMVLVFAHSDFEETNEVELSGNDSSHDHHSNKCVIM